MIESLKQFRKRHLSNDPILGLFSLAPCSKVETDEASEAETPRKILTKDDEETKIVYEQVELYGAHEGQSDEEPALKQHPTEPVIVDQPIRCPHPEPCIIQDGRALKERPPSMKRRGQLPFLTAGEVQRLRWNRRTAPNDFQIYPAASAPEPSFLDALSPNEL
ncbi:hypothetical protein KP509_25G049600 [Ceratopteris richardii]|uniref:Uncharacterized protein n=1 Tax=Ceratopteris richardii TaxID=49495 RepID=A0A8T2RQ61_CERRI|nr:hypothetical protein KP509_25G049600 [Ceratopteris richardii]